MLGVGNGGYSGSIPFHELAYDGLVNGFATWATDTGHQSGIFDAAWALNNDEAIADFGWRAVHYSAVAAPAIARSFYTTPFWTSTYKYWLGCSTGGRQGLKSVVSFPEDFDGVVVGSPARWMTRLQAGGARQNVAIKPVWERWGEDPAAFWSLVHDEVMKQCDHLDGLSDGILENPRDCQCVSLALLAATRAKGRL